MIARGRAIVIGGGLSGVLIAAHLLRRGREVDLIEPRAEPGRGAAYRADAEGLVLNVPAGKMSLWPDVPNDFVAWLRRRDTALGPNSFASRPLFGAYVRDTFAAVASARLRVHRSAAVDLQRRAHGFAVRLADQTTLQGAGVALALGNATPRPLTTATAGQRSPRVVDDPITSPCALAPDAEDTVAIVGAGLTALDTVMRLERRGHRGRVILISRHGLIPLAHRELLTADLPEPPASLRRAPRLRELLRWVRALAADLDRHGRDPARCVDALRPLTAEIWRGLDRRQRERFLRHARTYWDVHRHRVDPEALAMLTRRLRDGRGECRAAHFLSYVADPHGVVMRLRRRGATSVEPLRVDWLVNCTGPERNLRRQSNPLVRALLRRRLVRPDPLGLGASTGANGELLDATGRIVPCAFVVGPWRIGDLWESVAVPELRVQASDVAARLDAALTSHVRMPSDVARQPQPAEWYAAAGG